MVAVASSILVNSNSLTVAAPAKVARVSEAAGLEGAENEVGQAIIALVAVHDMGAEREMGQECGVARRRTSWPVRGQCVAREQQRQ